MMRFSPKASLPTGFLASGISCGIRKSKRLDLALFYTWIPAVSACVFTANKIIAAPIKVCKRHLKANRFIHAILVNSGNANCFTAEPGVRDAEVSASCVARALGKGKESILVASTGIIGKRLPVKKIIGGIPTLVDKLSPRGIHQAKSAILTTDSFAKEATVKCLIGGKNITICGVAKGAGMIAPDMATMLAFVLTDACISQRALTLALRSCVAESFNCITVDGCMSTNDSVMVLANGAAGNKKIERGTPLAIFQQALKKVCLELAKAIVRDAEGATKFLRIAVSGARDGEDARKAALFIANSNLLKTAVFGENPNFGRIVAAVGASGINVREQDIHMKVSSLKKRDVSIEVRIGRGVGHAVVYTSDLTPEYIKINAAYN
jgi:glutamate N-acetyltransferase/amino-acid N-acetyltransferase